MFLDSDQTNETWYAAADMRAMLAALVAAPRVRGMAPSIVANSMAVQVAPGGVLIPDTTANLGSWGCYMDAAENVTIPTAPAAGQFRTDLVVARVRPTTRDWILDVVTGTPSATAPGATPATPALCAPLASVAITGGQPTLASATLTVVATPTGALFPGTRINWTRQANIAGAGTYIDVGGAGPGPGGVPANDYVSLAVANLTTTMTVLRVCYLNLAVAAFAQTNGGIFRMVTRGATIDRELDSQGGGQFAGQVNWSGLFNPGETVAVSFRTSGGSLFNFAGEISALPAAPFTQLTGN